MAKKWTSKVRTQLRALDKVARFTGTTLRGAKKIQELAGRHEQAVKLLKKFPETKELATDLKACMPGKCARKTCSGACFFGERHTAAKLVLRSYDCLCRFHSITDFTSGPVRLQGTKLETAPAIQLVNSYLEAISNMEDEFDLYEIAAIGVVVPRLVNDRVKRKRYWELSLRAAVAGHCGDPYRWSVLLQPLPHDTAVEPVSMTLPFTTEASACEIVLDHKGKEEEHAVPLSDAANHEVASWLHALSGMGHVLLFGIPTQKVLGPNWSQAFEKQTGKD